MKDPKKLLVLLLLPLIFVVACKKNGPEREYNNTVSAKVDGASWSGDATKSCQIGITTSCTYVKKINFTNASNSTYMFIDFGGDPYFADEKTYSANDANFMYQVGHPNNANFQTEGFAGATASMKITDYEPGWGIAGTFSFHAYNTADSSTVSISDGSFDLNLEE